MEKSTILLRFKTTKMKRFILLAVIALTMSVGGYGVYSAQTSEVKASDLLLENVEALAQNEDGFTVNCSYSCNDGIGQCWEKVGGECVRSDDPHNYCVCMG